METWRGNLLVNHRSAKGFWWVQWPGSLRAAGVKSRQRRLVRQGVSPESRLRAFGCKPPQTAPPYPVEYGAGMCRISPVLSMAGPPI